MLEYHVCLRTLLQLTLIKARRLTAVLVILIINLSVTMGIILISNSIKEK